MFAEQIRRAIQATPRANLCELQEALWKAHGAGLIQDDEAQALAEAIQARKAIRATPPQPRRVGSRPRAPESMVRRRRWTSSGWLPPQIAARFTMAENAVLAVVSAEVAKRGHCRLTLGHIAALAGVCKTTVKSTMREAKALGFVTIEEWRIAAWRNAPNTIRIVSPEWTTWIRMRRRQAEIRGPAPSKGGGVKFVIPTNTRDSKPLTEKERAPTKKKESREEKERGQCRLVTSTRASDHFLGIMSRPSRHGEL